MVKSRKEKDTKKLTALRKASAGQDVGNAPYSRKIAEVEGLPVYQSVADEYCDRWYSMDYSSIVGADIEKVLVAVAKNEMNKIEAKRKGIFAPIREVIPQLTVTLAQHNTRGHRDASARYQMYNSFNTLSDMVDHYLVMDHSKCKKCVDSKVNHRGMMYLVHVQLRRAKKDFHCAQCTRTIERVFLERPRSKKDVGEKMIKMAKKHHIPREMFIWSMTNKHTYSCFYRRGIAGPCEVKLTEEEMLGLKDALELVRSGTKTILYQDVEKIDDMMFIEAMNDKYIDKWRNYCQLDRFSRGEHEIKAEAKEMLRDFKKLRYLRKGGLK
jgi:hypothetical protein